MVLAEERGSEEEILQRRDYRVKPGNDMGGGNDYCFCRGCFAEWSAVSAEPRKALGKREAWHFLLTAFPAETHMVFEHAFDAPSLELAVRQVKNGKCLRTGLYGIA